MIEDAKVILKTLHDISSNLEEGISSLQTAFIYNSVTPLKDIREKINELKGLALTMTEKIVHWPEIILI